MRRIILVALLVLFALLEMVFLGDLLFKNLYPFPQKIEYGLTFSPKFVSSLNMDWKEVYIKVLDDLKVRYLRLPTYWDILEPEPLKYDFSTTDFMLDEALKRGAKVIMVLGARQYRWPECHIPDFAKPLNVKDRQKKILEFVRVIVEKYKSHPAITTWEVENEPLLSSYGDCDSPDRNFLKTEVELVRDLDKRPIILTDSGELRPWVTPMRLSDIFGTTLYRTVYNKLFGFTDYPILPYLYNVKSSLVRLFFAPNNKKTIIIELQAEPWSPDNNLVDTPTDKQQLLFSTEKFKDNINFAKDTGFDAIYLWGVEWWYFMAQKGHPEYLDFAKTLFAN